MPLSATPLDLTTVIRELGRGIVFYEVGAFAGTGTDLTLIHLGDTEGEIKVEMNVGYQSLKTPELTGEIEHVKYFQGMAPKVTIPLFSAGAALDAIVSPVGLLSGGRDRRVLVTEYTLVIFPEELFIEADAAVALGYTTGAGWTVGGDAATAAQLLLLDKSIFFWRGHFEPLEPIFKHEDAGKLVQEVVFTPMHNGDMQQGNYIFTKGQPNDQSPAIEVSVA